MRGADHLAMPALPLGGRATRTILYHPDRYIVDCLSRHPPYNATYPTYIPKNPRNCSNRCRFT